YDASKGGACHGIDGNQDGTGRRIRPPSRNALFAVFQREDEGSRAAQVASSWAEQTGESKRMDQELEPQEGSCLSGCPPGTMFPRSRCLGHFWKRSGMTCFQAWRTSPTHHMQICSLLIQ
uniref:Uncharacterized protein n=1 Tax=Zea mays TaxID=4577 RepID=A0A804PW88_MAIZE